MADCLMRPCFLCTLMQLMAECLMRIFELRVLCLACRAQLMAACLMCLICTQCS